MTPAFKYFGSKIKMGGWICQHFPPHKIYTEAFGGAAAVLLYKQRSELEYFNDLNNQIVNFFQVLRDDKQAKKLIRQLHLTPYSRTEFEQAIKSKSDDPIENARRFVIASSCVFSNRDPSNLHKADFCSNIKSTRQNVRLFKEYPDTIYELTERLRYVVVECRQAVHFLRRCDSADALHYIDPPYLNVKSGYTHSMSDLQHVELLETCLALKGMVILSGYDHPLYNKYMKTFVRRNYRTSFIKKGTTTECLWLSPNIVERLGHPLPLERV